MSRPGAPAKAPTTAVGRADTWIRRIVGVTVAGLAGIAGALSYSHMRQLAEAHGNAGWHAHTLLLSVDGVEVVASLVLLADRRTSRRSGWLPWAALLIGTAASLAANVATASLAANVATADPSVISRIIAGWPALALLIAVKLLSGILEHRDAAYRPTATVLDSTVVPDSAAVSAQDDTARLAPSVNQPDRPSAATAVSAQPWSGTAGSALPAARSGTSPDLAVLFPSRSRRAG